MKFNNDTLVSVLTVVENDTSIATAFVEETSRVMSENYRYYELVIVDNNSSDGTDFLIQSLQKSVPNVRLLRLSSLPLLARGGIPDRPGELQSSNYPDGPCYCGQGIYRAFGRGDDH